MIICMWLLGIVVGFLGAALILLAGHKAILKEKNEQIEKLEEALGEIAVLSFGEEDNAPRIAIEALEKDK